MTREIPLTQGKVALVSDEDYERVSAYRWRAGMGTVTWYASSGTGKGVILMHRFILDAPSGMMVDHKNGNGLDNRRENIRLCTRHQNGQNHITSPAGRSGYTGVRSAPGGRWYASITVYRQRLRLGCYNAPEDAAIAYNHAAAEHFGDFATFNDIPGWESVFPQRRVKSKTSVYRGVSWRPDQKKWQSQGPLSTKRHGHLGYFASEEAAARAYDAAARQHHGEFARLNFPEPKSTHIK